VARMGWAIVRRHHGRWPGIPHSLDGEFQCSQLQSTALCSRCFLRSGTSPRHEKFPSGTNMSRSESEVIRHNDLIVTFPPNCSLPIGLLSCDTYLWGKAPVDVGPSTQIDAGSSPWQV
jgi:hypothetical protein